MALIRLRPGGAVTSIESRISFAALDWQNGANLDSLILLVFVQSQPTEEQGSIALY